MPARRLTAQRMRSLLALAWPAALSVLAAHAGPAAADETLARGRRLAAQYQCGACHRIEGVPGADGRVAPALTALAQRSYLAGRVPNHGDALERWIQDPASLVPGTTMPSLGVSRRDAIAIAAYLRSLP
jgi:cytochrome c